MYSLVHSIVNLNRNQGESEHKKHRNILKTHLDVFPCFLWMFIRGPWILDGKLPETGNILHKEIRNSFSSLGELSNIYLRSYSHFLKYPWMTINFFGICTSFSLYHGLNVKIWSECVWSCNFLYKCWNAPWERKMSF